MKVNPDTYIFSFGKHKGYSYETVLVSDAQYIVWCADNIEWFELDDSDYHNAAFKAMKQRSSGSGGWGNMDEWQDYAMGGPYY